MTTARRRQPGSEVFPLMWHLAGVGMIAGAVIASVAEGPAAPGLASAITLRLLGGALGGLLGILMAMLFAVEAPEQPAPAPGDAGLRGLWDPWLDSEDVRVLASDDPDRYPPA